VSSHERIEWVWNPPRANHDILPAKRQGRDGYVGTPRCEAERARVVRSRLVFVWVVLTMAVDRDRLGRRRPTSEEMGRQGGGIERVITYRCANPRCGLVWPVRTRAKRFDSLCRNCGQRNTIQWSVSTRTLFDRRGRPPKVSFTYWPDLESAQRAAIRLNARRMAARNQAVGSTDGFITATEYQARIDQWARRHDPE
jgi:hypothetical protein